MDTKPMIRERVLEILHDTLSALSDEESAFPKPPDPIPESAALSSLGINTISAHRFTQEMATRIGVPINFHFMLANQAAAAAISPTVDTYTRVSHLVDHVMGSLDFGIKKPEVVYVDDEEENLFVFRRKFGSRLNLKTFDSPVKAMEYILGNQNVVLVLTDEVMPSISGNQLRDRVHLKKPFLKFILITGNPTQDADLMYRSLRGNRFFDFFSKPLNLEQDEAKYLGIMKKILDGDFF